jgi:hypothetical protein
MYSGMQLKNYKRALKLYYIFISIKDCIFISFKDCIIKSIKDCIFISIKLVAQNGGPSHYI